MAHARTLQLRTVSLAGPSIRGAGSGGWGGLRSEVKEEAKGRGTRTKQCTPAAWSVHPAAYSWS